METEAIELHDSVLSAVVRREEDVRLLLRPAYVHRSDGRPGLDKGTGWCVDADIVVSRVGEQKVIAALPCHIWDGVVGVASREYSNCIPLPLAAEGPVKLTIELTNGETIEMIGGGIATRSVGPYRFVEEFEPAV